MKANQLYWFMVQWRHNKYLSHFLSHYRNIRTPLYLFNNRHYTCQNVDGSSINDMTQFNPESRFEQQDTTLATKPEVKSWSEDNRENFWNYSIHNYPVDIWIQGITDKTKWLAVSNWRWWGWHIDYLFLQLLLEQWQLHLTASFYTRIL